MPGWPEVRLDECCEIVSGATPSTAVAEYWGGDICWVTPKDLSELEGAVIADTPRKITEAGLASCAAEVLPAGSVLFSSRAPIGHVAVNAVPMATNQGFKSFIPKRDRIDARFLYWWLKAHRSYMEGLGNGATFKEVSKAVVSRVRIPLPPLCEQRRIAEVLDRAEALRTKRRKALARLSDLPQALFLDLFGDPVANPKEWSAVELSGLLENIDSGWSPTCLDRPVMDGEWGVLKLGAVTWCEYDATQTKALPADVSPRPELEVRPGDLLFARKNTAELVAACALVRSTPPRLMLPDLIFRLRLRTDAPVVPGYLHQLLINPRMRREIQKLAGGSAGSMPNISKAKLRGVRIAVPPVDLQQEFARQVDIVEDLRDLHRTAIGEVDALFASLQHRAFRGEL